MGIQEALTGHPFLQRHKMIMLLHGQNGIEFSILKQAKMKVALVLSLFNIVVGCSSLDKSINTEDNTETKAISVMSDNDTFQLYI